MKTIVVGLIVCCAGAFFACEQSVVNPPPPPPSGELTASNYMLTAQKGDSATFTQTVYDSLWNAIDSSKITLTVLATNVPMINHKTATKIVYVQNGSKQSVDTEYITCGKGGMVSYYDTLCERPQNLLLDPLGDTVFPIDPSSLINGERHIDSISTRIKTHWGVFDAALKVTEIHTVYGTGNDIYVDSTATEIYYTQGYMDVYKRATEVRIGDNHGDREHVVTHTVTDLASKSW